METKTEPTAKTEIRETAVEYYTRIWKEESLREPESGQGKYSYLSSKPNAWNAQPPNIAKITEDVKLAEHNGCPWLIPEKLYSSGVTGLHEEIEDFFSFMTPKYSEHQLRLLAVRRLETYILSLWPSLRIEVFGSLRTGLYLPTSDIDMVLIGYPQTHGQGSFLYQLQDAFARGGIAEIQTIKVIQSPNTKVSVIKLTEKYTHIKIDICLEVETGIRAAELVKTSIEAFPAIPKLVLILKQFLLQRDLNGVFGGGVSSYSLILMVWSFLQHSRLPVRSGKVNLGILLVELLEFYSIRFNYKKVAIRVKDGGEYIRKEMVHHNHPAHSTKPKGASIITIEDPLESGNDISNGSYNAEIVLNEFYAAFHHLSRATITGIHETNKTRRSFLGSIMQITEKVMAYRQNSDEFYDKLSKAGLGDSSIKCNPSEDDE